MQPYIYLIISAVISAVTAMVMMPWLLHLCYRTNLFDKTDSRKIHKQNIPRMGGIVFVPSTLVGTTTTFAIMLGSGNLSDSIQTSTLLISAGVALIYFIGFIDDLFGVSANLKFAVQLLASLAFPISGLYLNSLYGFMGIEELPLWASYAITVFTTLLIINAMNLIDGIDGLASGITLIALGVFTFLFYQRGYYNYCIFASGLAGVLCVFLYYNIFGKVELQQKTFMGDSGSLFLGFTLSYLGIKFAMINPEVIEPHPDGLLVAYTLILIPVFDLIRVAIRRKLRGGSMFEADKSHIHHKLMYSGRSQAFTLLTILGMDIVFVALNVFLFHIGLQITWIVAIDIVLFSIWQMRVAHLMERNIANELAKADICGKFHEIAANAKKICILAPRFPMPENGGDVLRINNIARQLRKQGYKLILVSFHDDVSPQIFEAQRIYHKIYTIPRSRWRSIVNTILFLLTGRPLQCGYYYSTAYKELLQKVIKRENPDIFLPHLLRMVPYIEELGLEERSVVEMTDALSKTYSMSSGAKGGNLLRIAYLFEHNLIKNYERHVIERFPKCNLVSQADIAYLKTLTSHNTSLELHANGVECLKHIPKSYEQHKICFIGNMRTLQNQDAVFYLVNEIFPLILKGEPKTTLYIIGAQPPRSIQQLACNNIVVTGFVKNLEATISDFCLALAPVRVAAGIQNKVLVAMGCGLPVVLTTLIARAIPELVDEENAMIRDEAATIAEACLRIMRHPDLRQKLSIAGYETVQNHYSWREKIRNYIA